MSKKNVTVDVLGMTCASCARTVERSLQRTTGVEDASVNIATERATVTFDPTVVSLTGLVQKIRDSGYDARTERVILPIGGMTCAACVRHVERALNKVDGVSRATVNLATERAVVEYLPGLASLDNLKQAVSDAGYQVLEQTENTSEGESADPEVLKMQQARRRMVVAWSFTVPIVVIMFLHMVAHIAWPSMMAI